MERCGIVIQFTGDNIIRRMRFIYRISKAIIRTERIIIDNY